MGRPQLSASAVELSTYEVPITFTDSSGEPVTPDSVTWSLSTLGGGVINAREDVSETPAAEVTVVLSGADLAILPGESGVVRRLLTVRATYSSTEGAGLPVNEEFQFMLRPLVMAP